MIAWGLFLVYVIGTVTMFVLISFYLNSVMAG